MSNQFQETTYKSWGTRLKESLGGIIFGLIALFAMPTLLFWNEGRAVQTAKSLTEGAGLVRAVSADRIDDANADRLVHVSGDLVVDKALVDPATGISVKAVRIVRRAEMYQWVESCSSKSERKLGGGEETVTTCTYAREWREGRVSSEGFRQPSGHTNPDPTLKSGRVSQDLAKIGAFTAGEDVFARLSGDTKLQITPKMMEVVRERLPDAGAAQAQGNIINLSSNASPVVGDMRLVFSIAEAGPVSVIGQQANVQGRTQFTSYQTEAGDRLLLVDRGVVPAAAMFKQAEEANVIITWIIRAIGLLFLFVGFAMMLRPLAVLADVVPIAGTIVRYGTGTVAAILALLIGGVTIGIAWIWYRPLLGISIMAAAAAIALFLWKRGARRAAQVGLPA